MKHNKDNMVINHGSETESHGLALVTALETFRGCSIKLAGKREGFNGLSVGKSGEIRKIEVKTVKNSDDWFAINGLYGIEKLFFDSNYWIYFSIIPENIVVVVNALPFMHRQVMTYDHSDINKLLRNWIDLTQKLSEQSGMSFIPRINFKVEIPIRRLVKRAIAKELDQTWAGVLAEIWQLKPNGKWKRLFR